MINDTTMRHKNRTQVSCNELLTEVQVIPSNTGDIARGVIRLMYQDTMVEVPYDTKGGPDGLMTVLDCGLGDFERGSDDGEYVDVLITEKVLTDAKNYFSGDIRHKAVRGTMTVKEV